MNYDNWLQSDKDYEEFHGLSPDRAERNMLRNEELLRIWELEKEERFHSPPK